MTAALCLALGLLLPSMFHMIGAGTVFLPMHIPVLLCGMLCGGAYGAAVGAIVPLAAAFLGKRSGNWRLWVPVAIIAALIGAVCMRVAFYNLGLSVFMFY